MIEDYTTARTVFTRIYDEKIWGEGSGASSPSITGPYMRMLDDFMRNNDVRSVVDVGCGDWQFSRHIAWGTRQYRGFDVVESVVSANKSQFSREGISFHLLTAMDELPPADLVVCKDVLQHLPTHEVVRYLDYFVDRYRWAIVTNDRSITMIGGGTERSGEHLVNLDTNHGGHRPLRLDLPPFGRKVASLVQWEIEAPDYRWVKDACLLIK